MLHRLLQKCTNRYEPPFILLVLQRIAHSHTHTHTEVVQSDPAKWTNMASSLKKKNMVDDSRAPNIEKTHTHTHTG